MLIINVNNEFIIAYQPVLTASYFNLKKLTQPLNNNILLRK
jgi:hypothetical protein